MTRSCCALAQLVWFGSHHTDTSTVKSPSYAMSSLSCPVLFVVSVLVPLQKVAMASCSWSVEKEAHCVPSWHMHEFMSWSSLPSTYVIDAASHSVVVAALVVVPVALVLVVAFVVVEVALEVPNTLSILDWAISPADEKSASVSSSSHSSHVIWAADVVVYEVVLARVVVASESSMSQPYMVPQLVRTSEEVVLVVESPTDTAYEVLVMHISAVSV